MCAEHWGPRPHRLAALCGGGIPNPGKRCPRAGSPDSLTPPTGDGFLEPGAVPRPQSPHPSPGSQDSGSALSGRHRAVSVHPWAVCEGDSRGQSICKQAGVPPGEAPLAEGPSWGSGQRKEALSGSGGHNLAPSFQETQKPRCKPFFQAVMKGHLSREEITYLTVCELALKM